MRSSALRLITLEAWRNVTTARARTAIAIALMILCLSATIVETFSSAHSALLSEKKLYRSGYHIVVLTGPAISGTQCEALNGIDGVEAAGAIRPAGNAILRPGDLSTYILFESSPSFARVMSPGEVAPEGPHVIGAELATEVGILAPDSRRLMPLASDGLPKDARIVSLDQGKFRPNNSYYGRAVIRNVGLAAKFVECDVLLKPPVAPDSPQLVAGLLRGAGPVQGQWLLDRATFGEPPIQAFSQRPARWLWLILALATGLAILALNRSRSVEFALYRSQGASVSLMAVIVASEFALISIVALMFWPLSFILVDAQFADPDTRSAMFVALRSGLAYTSAGILGSAVGAWLSTLGQPWELLRRQ